MVSNFGSYLINNNIITSRQLEKALKLQVIEQGSLDSIISKILNIELKGLFIHLDNTYHQDKNYFMAEKYYIDKSLALRFKREATKYNILPIACDNEYVYILSKTNLTTNALDYLQDKLDKIPMFHVIPEVVFNFLLQELKIISQKNNNLNVEELSNFFKYEITQENISLDNKNDINKKESKKEDKKENKKEDKKESKKENKKESKKEDKKESKKESKKEDKKEDKKESKKENGILEIFKDKISIDKFRGDILKLNDKNDIIDECLNYFSSHYNFASFFSYKKDKIKLLKYSSNNKKNNEFELYLKEYDSLSNFFKKQNYIYMKESSITNWNESKNKFGYKFSEYIIIIPAFAKNKLIGIFIIDLNKKYISVEESNNLSSIKLIIKESMEKYLISVVLQKKVKNISKKIKKIKPIEKNNANTDIKKNNVNNDNIEKNNINNDTEKNNVNNDNIEKNNVNNDNIEKNNVNNDNIEKNNVNNDNKDIEHDDFLFNTEIEKEERKKFLSTKKVVLNAEKLSDIHEYKDENYIRGDELNKQITEISKNQLEQNNIFYNEKDYNSENNFLTNNNSKIIKDIDKSSEQNIKQEQNINESLEQEIKQEKNINESSEQNINESYEQNIKKEKYTNEDLEQEIVQKINNNKNLEQEIVQKINNNKDLEQEIVQTENNNKSINEENNVYFDDWVISSDGKISQYIKNNNNYSKINNEEKNINKNNKDFEQNIDKKSEIISTNENNKNKKENIQKEKENFEQKINIQEKENKKEEDFEQQMNTNDKMTQIKDKEIEKIRKYEKKQKRTSFVEKLSNANPEDIYNILSYSNVDESEIQEVLKIFPGKFYLDEDIRFQNLLNTKNVKNHSSVLYYLLENIDKLSQLNIRHLSTFIKDQDINKQIYSLYLFTKIKNKTMILNISDKIISNNEIISTLAVKALRNQRSFDNYKIIRFKLESIILSKDLKQIKSWLYAVNVLKEEFFVPKLITGIEHFRKNKKTQNMIIETLQHITKNNFSDSIKKWNKWWLNNKYKKRNEWIIEGLQDKDLNIRISSYVEAKNFIKNFFSYDVNLSKKELKTEVEKIKNDFFNE